MEKPNEEQNMTPEQTAIVIQRSIQGVSSRDIAEEIGTSHTSVYRVKQKDDVKAIVEKGISKLMKRGLNPSVNTLCRFAALGNSKNIMRDKDFAKISLDASKTILSHVNGSGPQTIINQLIYSQGAHRSVDKCAIDMLSKALTMSIHQVDENIVDIEPVDKPVDN
jgi:hypothetical protein